ncbi:MAG: cobyric acid synthase [Lentisphaerales bacterium]|nr:cobyric acid synthase [Lentisphaerales bacterium]
MSGHGGNIRSLTETSGRSAEDILDYSANINPLGPPAWLRSVISHELDMITHYPDPENSRLTEAVSEAWSLPSEMLLFGNGANELIYALPRALNIKRVIIHSPAYIDYKNAAISNEKEVLELPLNRDFSIDWQILRQNSKAKDLVILAHPNNPSGNLLQKEEVLSYLNEFPEVYVMIDEAFIEFAGYEHSFAQEKLPNLIVMRSFTKFYAIPGLRLGCMIANAEIVKAVRKKLCDWSVNTLAQATGIKAVQDANFHNECFDELKKFRQQLIADLTTLEDHLHIYPSVANFLLCRLSKSQAPELADYLLQKYGIAIRVCENYTGLDSRFFRIAVKKPENNKVLVQALKTFFGQKVIKPRRPHPSLMIQGTSSNAGKSLLVSAFCRIMLQDGLKISPFKSQNMALNSFVTQNGLEIARAQVVQAQAARQDPDIRMNPILLKPNGNRMTQIIINGKAIGNMSWPEYIKFKPQAFEGVKKSYDSLCDEFDAIVLEGAGSPAEVNLKHSDIVNMGMASYSRSPVLLAGDIDRGGIFASFIGTMDILTQEERKLVSGFLVNRFRGDVSLLQGALDFTLQHTGKPVVGVVPYVPNLNLPEEDSLSFREVSTMQGCEGEIKIVALNTPCLANFTDFDPLLIEPDVSFNMAKQPSDLKAADLIILPGSKSTMADLQYIRDNGFEEELKNAAARGVNIIGICGGFQMLGSEILDPLKIESSQASIAGLGLLQAVTTMAKDKTLKQVSVQHLQKGLKLQGYEIHHGETQNFGSEVLFKHQDDILGLQNNNVWGTYLHGLFENDAFRRAILNDLRQKKSLSSIEDVTPYDIEPSLNLLADAVRESVNMQEIYRKMGL